MFLDLPRFSKTLDLVNLGFENTDLTKLEYFFVISANMYIFQIPVYYSGSKICHRKC